MNNYSSCPKVVEVDCPQLPMPAVSYGFKGDGKKYNKRYYELESLMREYLATLDDESNDEWYCTNRKVADDQLEGFFEWLLVNRKLD